MSNQCTAFIKEFCDEFSKGSTLETGTVPFDIVRSVLLKDEIEGQCIDWLLCFLSKRLCPSYLASVLTRTIVNKVLLAVQNQHDSSEPPGSVSADSLRRIVFTEAVNAIHSVDQQSLTVLDDPQTSVHAIKNTRRKMEDRHVMIPYFNQLFKCNYSSYYAVFDGHGGVDAAQYAATHLHCLFARRLQTTGNVQDALKQSFIETDKMFIDHANKENLASGSTAVCALVERNLLHIAWLGDSQALIVREGQPVQLMSPHKPEREDERKRIEDLGGCVLYIGTWRVNGTLSVSRAIGDASSKPYVSGEPDVISVSYKPGDWLVLACDGLWDQVTYEDVAATVCEENTSTTIAQRLVRLAKDQGSSDNITVLAVHLETPVSVCEEAESSAFSDQTKDQGEGKRPDKGGHEDDSNANNSDNNFQAGRSEVSRDRVNSANESSRLAMSIKRSAEVCLEDIEDEQASRARQQNVCDASKLTDIATPRSDLSSSWTTTSDDISKKSLDTSSETGLSSADSYLLQVKRRLRRRSSHGMIPLKENRLPLDGAAGTTPPCVHHASPPPFDDPVLKSHKSCRSLSWASSGPLNAMVQRACSSTLETRYRTPAIGAPSSRWTIAVEVDADVEMFDSNFADIAMKLPAMNMSTHW